MVWGEADAVTEIFLIFFGTDVLVYNRDFLAGLLLVEEKINFRSNLKMGLVRKLTLHVATAPWLSH